MSYQGVMIIGENIKRLIVANYEDEFVGESIDVGTIVVGESRYQVIAAQSVDSNFGGPRLNIGKLYLGDLLSIDSELYDEISSEDIERGL